VTLTHCQNFPAAREHDWDCWRKRRYMISPDLAAERRYEKARHGSAGKEWV